MTERSPLLVDLLRSRTRDDINALMASLGFQRGSGDWTAAEAAEMLIFRGPAPDAAEYHLQLGFIAEFLGLPS